MHKFLKNNILIKYFCEPKRKRKFISEIRKEFQKHNNTIASFEKEDLRSNSGYKLIEIQRRYNILNSNVKNIIELGSSPGSFSQVIKSYLPNSNVIAIDKDNMLEVISITIAN